jgi:hypothetical protein
MVVNGCGLIAVHRPADASYWYEGFGSPPVAVGLWGTRDSGGAIWSTTRLLDCARSEQVICSACGDIYPSCKELSGWLPEPLPLPPPGCSCESEGEDGARVSLDCFCSVYECPSYSAVVHDCDVEPNDRQLSLRRATEGCGQVWFESGAVRFGYDPNGGELVAAEAWLDVPVTLPCYTSRVTAGAVVECAEPVDCSCNAADPVALFGPGHESDSCEDTSWFQAISGSESD